MALLLAACILAVVAAEAAAPLSLLLAVAAAAAVWFVGTSSLASSADAALWSAPIAVADLAVPFVTPPIAAAVAATALAGVGVLTGAATAIAAATGCAALAAAFAAAAAAVASVVAAPPSSPPLPLADDVFAGAAGAADWIWVGSAGGGALFGAAGFAWESELFGPLAAFVVALLAAWGVGLLLGEVLEAVLPPFAGGLFVPFGGGGAVLLFCVAAGFGLRVDGWVETWLCERVPPADIGTGFIGAGLAAGGGFAGAAVVSGVVVVASSNAANGWESATGAGVGAGDHCSCANDDVELTSDAILDTA
jgi:hypothetical protein